MGGDEEGETLAGKNEGKEKEEKDQEQDTAVSGRGTKNSEDAEGTSEDSTPSTSNSSSSASLNGEEDKEKDGKKDKEEKGDLALEEDNVRQLTRFNSTEVIAKTSPPASPSGGSGDREPDEAAEPMVLDGEENAKNEKTEGDKAQKEDEDEEDRGDRPLFAHPSTPEGSGATAVVVLVVGGDEPVVITANAGDSRGVICRGGTV